MIDLVESLDKRNEVINNIKSIEILENVKKILTLGNTEFVTVQMTAEYYEVGIEAINSLIKDNREELVENGLLTTSGKKVKEILVKSFEDITNFRGYFMIEGQKFSNNKNTLISKRVLLNIGMLLRDSEIAKELRSRILDVVFDAEKNKGSIEAIVNEIDEEMQLKVDYVDAMMNGDINKMNQINAKLFELKNKRIEKLELEVRDLNETLTDIVDTNVSYETLRRELVANLGNIAKRSYNSNYQRCYGEFYKFLKNNGMNLELRRTNRMKKVLNEMDDYDIDLAQLNSEINRLKELPRTRENIQLKKEKQKELKDIKTKYREAKRLYKLYEGTLLNVIDQEEYKDIIVITRSWALANGYNWKEGLDIEENSNLPY